ncbi:geraniol 8-hydroxylase-like [Arachis stenosperma]|uniref:geraniol 8-hydroxylase-like n=1 Tax=Arachis stenosperma TaxID=217475 RepID=UPI0025AD583A|nr:geraniol 8-hydroxylase-like [Arachis stenosperma]
MDLVSFVMLLLLLLTCTTLYSLHYLNVRRSKANYKLPPGPSPLPIIGNLHELGNKPHHSSAILAKIHGPIMTLKLGQLTTIVISSAEMAKMVLQTYDQFLSNRTVPEAARVHNHHIHSIAFMPMTPLWRSLRKICNNQLFTNKTIDARQDLRRKKVQELLGEIHQSSQIGEGVDVGEAAFKTTINLLSNTIFSMDLIQSSGSAARFKDLVANITKESGKPNLADYFPALRMVDPQRIKAHNAIYAGKLLDIFHDLIYQRKKLILKTGSDTNKDMLEALLNISQENSKEMDKINIEHLMLTLFVAGTDTITSTLEWAMTELLSNPNTMRKAKRELEETIGKGNQVEESDIARLPYLQAILKETLRLHPSVPFLIPRKADTDVEINGYTIPKGSQVLINVYAIGRDSNVWKNDTNLFSPERFLGLETDVRGRHFELIPFGAGRRICPGLTYAMRILFLMLGSLVNCFDWKLENDSKAEDIDKEEEFGITLRKCKPLRSIPIKVNN